MSDVPDQADWPWERERRGNPVNTYWTGRLGAAKLLVFRNNRRNRTATRTSTCSSPEPSPPQQERPAFAAERGRATGEAIYERADAAAERVFSKSDRDAHVQELAERFDQRPPDEVPW
jgi:hypothetical protein